MQRVILTLFITGQTPRSEKAIKSLKSLCQEDKSTAIEIRIIDVLERPEDAEKEKIIATPTLIKTLPPPIRRVIGDLSDIEQVLAGLDLEMKNGNGTIKEG